MDELQFIPLLLYAALFVSAGIENATATNLSPPYAIEFQYLDDGNVEESQEVPTDFKLFIRIFLLVNPIYQKF